jgi:hypothetical protein
MNLDVLAPPGKHPARPALLLIPLPMGEVAPSDGAGVGPHSARPRATMNSASALAPSYVPSLAKREKVDGAMVALRFCDHRARRMRAGKLGAQV